ncbi:MAG: hypothetical protein HQL46_13925 [Gammaproteobacteria bacterium]|nr:hypothetical protein [Gammaproteobacteria bacterium]
MGSGQWAVGSKRMKINQWRDNFSLKFLVTLFLLLPISNAKIMAMDISGYIAASGLFFQQEPLAQEQHKHQLALSAEVEIYHAWNENRDSILFKPYQLIDQYDNERTHTDIRELLWLHVADSWELRFGISKVFWGVNEGNHLIDIINQSDQVDSITGDEKLGQPMINLNFLNSWGNIELFILPYFREQTYPGINGRFRSSLVVNADKTEFESSDKEKHIDYAIRWAHSFDEFDIGIHAFKGTNRSPRYLVKTASITSSPYLVAYYDQISQLGLDLQATFDAWLLKLEALYREDKFDKFTALSGGIEYTFNGIFNSSTDLGVVTEYSWDERNQPNLYQFQNDLLLAARVAFNNAQSSEMLIGIIQNLDHSQLRSIQIEASRRIGNNNKLILEMRWFDDHPFNPIHNDDHIQLKFMHYF